MNSLCSVPALPGGASVTTATPAHTRPRGALQASAALRAVQDAPDQPLVARTRDWIEPRLGHDFSQVRVLIGTAAERATRALGVPAFTIGRRLVFGSGQYAPDTTAGQRLLAHELAHVVQQAQGVAPDAARLLENDAQHRAARALDEKQRPAAPPRPLASVARPLIQCYQVPGSLRCNELVSWLNSSSPYRPEWAETRCTYSFNGNLLTRSRTLSDGRVQIVVRGHRGMTAAVDCPIDRPEWSPSERPRRDAEIAAWNAMLRSLDTHEQQHRRIGERWRGVLQARYRAIDFTVTGSDEADASTQAQERVAVLEQQYQADAQHAQDAIDPFRGATLTCPREGAPSR